MSILYILCNIYVYIYIDMVCTTSGKMSLQDLSISEGDFLQGQRRDTGARGLCFAAADAWGVNQQNWWINQQRRRFDMVYPRIIGFHRVQSAKIGIWATRVWGDKHEQPCYFGCEWLGSGFWSIATSPPKIFLWPGQEKLQPIRTRMRWGYSALNFSAGDAACGPTLPGIIFNAYSNMLLFWWNSGPAPQVSNILAKLCLCPSMISGDSRRHQWSDMRSG